MKITLLVVGKKNSPYDEMIQDYLKRMHAVFSVTIERIQPESLHDGDRLLNQKRESEKIIERWQSASERWLFDERGKVSSTKKFADDITAEIQKGTRHITMIIGGAYGVDDHLRSQATRILSLGGFIFPHEMVRLMVVEQLYRVHGLLQGNDYHHV